MAIKNFQNNALLETLLGALADAAVTDPTASVSIIAALKGILTDLGQNADAVVAAGATGSLSAKIRRLTTDLDGLAAKIGATDDAVVAAGAVGSLSAKIRRLTTDLDALNTVVTSIKDTAGVKKITDALPAGANLIGKTGIDQTTPGTTNAVAIDQTTPGTTNAVSLTGSLETIKMYSDLVTIGSDATVMAQFANSKEMMDRLIANAVGMDVFTSVQAALEKILDDEYPGRTILMTAGANLTTYLWSRKYPAQWFWGKGTTTLNGGATAFTTGQNNAASGLTLNTAVTATTTWTMTFDLTDISTLKIYTQFVFATNADRFVEVKANADVLFTSSTLHGLTLRTLDVSSYTGSTTITLQSRAINGASSSGIFSDLSLEV